ncbi:MAG: hypothetical protein J6B77_07545, partial [Clostridia bacterium]|nr:hypothetical protein [Clostridia bacterium]
LLDVFYEQKYVTPEQWQQTNGDTVVLCNLEFENRILVGGDRACIRLSVSDFSHPAFSAPTLRWSLVSEEGTLLSGEIGYTHEAYRTVPAGKILFTVPETDYATPVTLRVSLTEGERTVCNAWDLWIFPPKAKLPDGVYRSENGEFPEDAEVVVTQRMTPALVSFAENGGKVVLLAGEGLVRPFSPILHLSKGKYYFTRPASYPCYEELQSGTVIADHPIFGSFPHDSYADLKFYRMIGESPALDLEGIGLADEDPIIRSVHSYQIGRPLGYLLERRLGAGGVIVSALNFDPYYPEADYLLREITKYALERDYADVTEISAAALQNLLDGTNIDA